MLIFKVEVGLFSPSCHISGTHIVPELPQNKKEDIHHLMVPFQVVPLNDYNLVVERTTFFVLSPPS